MDLTVKYNKQYNFNFREWISYSANGFETIGDMNGNFSVNHSSFKKKSNAEISVNNIMYSIIRSNQRECTLTSGPGNPVKSLDMSGHPRLYISLEYNSDVRIDISLWREYGVYAKIDCGKVFIKNKLKIEWTDKIPIDGGLMTAFKEKIKGIINNEYNR